MRTTAIVIAVLLIAGMAFAAKIELWHLGVQKSISPDRIGVYSATTSTPAPSSTFAYKDTGGIVYKDTGGIVYKDY